MGRINLILAGAVVCCTWLFPAGCAEKLRSDRQGLAQPELGKKTPKISFEQVVYDFGDLAPKGRNVCEFKFTNVGDALLKVTKVKTCCGFKGNLKNSKKNYAPGENGAVAVEFDAARFRGHLTKFQYVHSNDKTAPRVQLTVKANIVAKVRHQPKELRLALRGDNAACPEITLSSVDDRPFAITSFTSTGNCINAPIDRRKKATSFVLQPRADVEKLKNNLNGHVRIRLTHPQSDTVLIPFKVLPEFQLNPRSIIVLNAEPRKPIRRDLWVLNNYGDDFEVESASSQKGTVTVLDREKFGNRYKFELEITPPPKEGDGGIFTDVFYVNTSDGRRLSVDCHGFYSSRMTGR